MRPDLVQRVEAVLGRRVVGWSRREGGFTPAERLVVQLEDGTSAFVKAATTQQVAEWLRREHAVYMGLEGPFAPRLIGWSDEGGLPLLVIEDLSAARWPPPWEQDDMDRVLEMLEGVAMAPHPDGISSVAETALGFPEWRRVERDPEPFLGLGLCSPEWLERALPMLLQADSEAAVAGHDLLHLDVRSDNLCFAQQGPVLVDWNLACVGNRDLDVAFWVPSLRMEGGPLPEEVLSDAPELAARVAGFFASRAPLPPIPDAPGVRRIQLRQLRQALPWVARELGLPPPDGRWAQPLVDEAEALLTEGAITEDEWYVHLEEVLADAYLSTDDPRAQSGKSGDELEWRWARELICDAFENDGTFLDVGCANGYLMESVHRWAAERGLHIEPYGVDISARLVSLARRRLPQWTDRIFVGNAMHWVPPRRFDIVHTGIDYVPQHRRRELVDRLLRDVVAPGGRLVFRAERVRPGAEDLAELLRDWGFSLGGVIERPHPDGHNMRRTAWISA